MEHPRDPAAILDDAEWLAHRFVGTDKVRFRHTSRSAHQSVPFATDEYLGPGETFDLPMTVALGSVPSADLNFVFHSAFCASTLLLRAFDQPGTAMGLSEPVILNDVVGMRRRREIDSQGVARMLDTAMILLARPWAAGEAVIVKPSNVLNPLAAGLLQLRPSAKAILLHAPLETFLTSVARKGIWCRLWVRELIEGLLIDNAIDLGFEPRDYLRQTDLQIAAVGWLAQHSIFHSLTTRFGPDRVRTLDSETFLTQPDRTLLACGRHYGLKTNEDDAARIAASDLFSRHSKSSEAFTNAERERAYAEVRTAHADEIEKVVEWAHAVARSAGLALNLPSPLVAE